MTHPPFRHEDYTVGWVCALPIELAASRKMMDERHPSLPRNNDVDTNLYTLGRIGQHNIVMACLPYGLTGTTPAATVAIQMKSTFPSIRFGLMVGIGGGVPSASIDIRLGDVVVSQPHMGHGGVVQYDFGKTRPNEFERTGFLNSPPTVLLNTIAVVQANHLTGESQLAEFLSCLSNLLPFAPPHPDPDNLFMASYNHIDGENCKGCSKRMLVRRPSRTEDNVVHFGTIASGNQLMRDGDVRDKLSSELGGVLCFEMEAAGLMNDFPCLIIRGISDYADSHKNKKWQGHAAATAAACAKDILSVIPARDVQTTPTVGEAIGASSTKPQHQSDLAMPGSTELVDSSMFAGSQGNDARENEVPSNSNPSRSKTREEEYEVPAFLKPQLDPSYLFRKRRSFMRRNRSWTEWTEDSSDLFQSLERWMSVADASLFVAKAISNDDGRQKATDFVVAVIDFLKSQERCKVIWALSYSVRPDDGAVPIIDIFKTLISQAIRLDPLWGTTESALSESEYGTEEIYQRLLTILSRMTECFVIIETNNRMWAGRLLMDLQKIADDSPATVKIMILAYGKASLEFSNLPLKDKRIVDTVPETITARQANSSWVEESTSKMLRIVR
ncbi:nucleoside phosphorylase domain-containing protein [Penicillium waksmanii]|uniref:nucleoside phosphorylase domain-containing protein n=1 Tax=Penicillium waksmanii TaxID=69791 RepID=UPI0025466AA0|nr:nucleoside phosphorylase domain-containing protein [Penicillium waksmanii]KAJ6000154.1 nucleoside phosphorylase domain-containing protein [Penicillium waksmanii]